MKGNEKQKRRKANRGWKKPAARTGCAGVVAAKAGYLDLGGDRIFTGSLL